MKRYGVGLSILFLGSLIGLSGLGERSEAVPEDAARKAAESLLSQIPPELRKQANLDFASEKRTDWHYFPREREGVAIGDLSDPAKEALWSLIRLALSEKGVEATKGVLTLEQVLYDLEKSESRNPNNFHFVFWGEPSAASPWGWRFEGHHLSINATFEGNRLVSITPTFFGANPAKVAEGPWAGFRNLPMQEDLAREFILALGKEQREKALQSGEPSDLVSAGAAAVTPPLGLGLRASELDEDRRELLRDLLEAYLGEFEESVREEAGLETERILGDTKLEIQWWGGMSQGEPHSYRLCGTTIDIQYATRGADANHVHTLVRVPGRDFGR